MCIRVAHGSGFFRPNPTREPQRPDPNRPDPRVARGSAPSSPPRIEIPYKSQHLHVVYILNTGTILYIMGAPTIFVWRGTTSFDRQILPLSKTRKISPFVHIILYFSITCKLNLNENLSVIKTGCQPNFCD